MKKSNNKAVQTSVSEALKETLFYSLAACLVVGVTACSGSKFNSSKTIPSTKTQTVGQAGEGDQSGNGLPTEAPISNESGDQEAQIGEKISTVGGEVVAEVPGVPPGTTVIDGKLDVRKNKSDLLFFVDTSGSMAQERDHVAKNMKAFLSKAKGYADLKVGVVASSSFRDEMKKSDSQIESSVSFFSQVVNSNDALKILSYGLKSSNDRCVYAKTISNNSLTDKAFAGFFRAGAISQIVVVTDDNATMVNETNFQSCTSSPGFSIQKVFGFIGKKDVSGCDIAQKGVAYEALASKIGGKTYDICEKDWSGSFNDLAVSSTILKFVVPGTFAKVPQLLSLSSKSDSGAAAAIPLAKAKLVLNGSQLSLELNELASNIVELNYKLVPVN